LLDVLSVKANHIESQGICEYYVLTFSELPVTREAEADRRAGHADSYVHRGTVHSEGAAGVPFRPSANFRGSNVLTNGR
jgi:hypothetical protein